MRPSTLAVSLPAPSSTRELQVTNSGKVPVEIGLGFGSLTGAHSTNRFQGSFEPGEERTLKAVFTAPVTAGSWSRQIVIYPQGANHGEVVAVRGEVVAYHAAQQSQSNEACPQNCRYETTRQGVITASRMPWMIFLSAGVIVARMPPSFTDLRSLPVTK